LVDLAIAILLSGARRHGRGAVPPVHKSACCRAPAVACDKGFRLVDLAIAILISGARRHGRGAVPPVHTSACCRAPVVACDTGFRLVDLAIAILLSGARRHGRGAVPRGGWPSHDIVITNIVWCIAYKREFGGGGVVYCPIIVH